MDANNIQRIIYDPSQIVELINNKISEAYKRMINSCMMRRRPCLLVSYSVEEVNSKEVEQFEHMISIGRSLEDCWQ